MKGRVSVHIVTYNSAPEIVTCLEGVQDQTYPIDSVIIVDNASEDETVYALERISFPALSLIRNRQNTGFAGAHNQALRHTNADYILLLNPDVVLHPDYVRSLVQVMEEEPRAGMAGGKLLKQHNPTLFDSTGIVMTRSRRFLDRAQNERDTGQYDEREAVFGITGAAVLYRREMIDDISIHGEFFDEDFFAYKEDVDVCWRANRFGWKAIYEPKALAYHDRGWDNQRGRSKISKKLRAHSYLNRYFTIIKNDTVSQIVRNLPNLFVYEMAQFIYILVREPFLLLTWKDFFRQLPHMWQKRKLIRSKRVKRGSKKG